MSKTFVASSRPPRPTSITQASATWREKARNAAAVVASKKLGRDKRIGTIDWERFNVLGGSIALGHPFAATGARQILHTLRELKRRRGEFALCTACASGGLGAAIVLEAA